MKKIQVKSENDVMSISVDGVPLKEDSRGNYIIKKEMESDIQLQDLPFGVPFTVERAQEISCINFVYHFCRKDSEKLHLCHTVDLNFECWMVNISLPLYAGMIVRHLLRLEGDAINIAIEGNIESATIKYFIHLDYEDLTSVICNADCLIEALEMRMEAFLDKVETLAVIESVK